MSRIQKAFENKKAFIAFLTAGDPSLDKTEEYILEMERAGADLIEIGIPFSDPTAEGPLVQEANLRAFAAGVSTDGVFDLVRELRSDVSVPFVFMTYANVIFSYNGKDGIGAEAFIRTCSAIGVDGLIVCDLPYEEKAEFLPLCRENGVALISQIAPASDERIAKIASDAEGFLYVIPGEDPQALIATARAHTKLPCILALAAPESDDLRQAAALADGVLVETAFVRSIAAHSKDAAPYTASLVREMKTALEG